MKSFLQNTITSLVIISLLLILLCGTNSYNTYKVLNEKGFQNIETQGFQWASRSYYNRTKFTATLNGSKVEGFVGYWFSPKYSNIVINN